MTAHTTLRALTLALAVAASSGCVRLPEIRASVPDWLQLPAWPAETEPPVIRSGVITRPAALASRDDGVPALSARNQWMMAGTFSGGLVGLGAGLATCAPSLFFPWVYPACVALTTVVGTAGGTVVGATVGGQATPPPATRSVQHVPSIVIDHSTLERLSGQIAVGLTAAGSDAVDLGAQAPARETLSPDDYEALFEQGVGTIIEVVLISAHWQSVGESSFHVAISARSRRIEADDRRLADGTVHDIAGATMPLNAVTPPTDQLATAIEHVMVELARVIASERSAPAI